MTFRMTAQEKSTTHSIPDTLGASTEASYELLLADFQLSEFDIRRSTAGNTHTREGAALPTLSDSELPDRWVHPPARIQLPRPPERTADIGTGESGLSSTRHLLHFHDFKESTEQRRRKAHLLDGRSDYFPVHAPGDRRVWAHFSAHCHCLTHSLPQFRFFYSTRIWSGPGPVFRHRHRLGEFRFQRRRQCRAYLRRIRLSVGLLRRGVSDQLRYSPRLDGDRTDRTFL